MVKFIDKDDRLEWDEYVNSFGGELDKIALSILRSHKKNHLACVAVCLYQAGYFVAANGFTPNEGITLQCISEEIGQQVTQERLSIVSMNHLSDMHAEMKMLCHLKASYSDNDIRGLKMGVSKPCCVLCLKVLESYGVEVSMWHNKEVFWLSPYPCNKVNDQNLLMTGGKEAQYDDDGDTHLILEYPDHFGNDPVTLAHIYEQSGYIE